MFLFEFLRVSGESRLVSDLNVQRRQRAIYQRIAFRLAKPTPSGFSEVARVAAPGGSITTPSENVILAAAEKTFVQAAIVNVPLSPNNSRETDSNDIMKDLPKCLMQSLGNVFD